jgi:hypothetical protein
MGSAVTVQMGDGEDMFTYNAAAVQLFYKRSYLHFLD